METVIQEKKDLINKLAEKAALRCGVDIYSIVVQLRKRNTKIDVRIDNGSVVSHNDCVDYSRALESLLDEAEITDYTLEISSPGLKRELRTIEECVRFTGAPVKIVYDNGGSHSVVKGLLTAVENGVLTLKEKKKNYSIDYNRVTKANLDY